MMSCNAVKQVRGEVKGRGLANLNASLNIQMGDRYKKLLTARQIAEPRGSMINQGCRWISCSTKNDLLKATTTRSAFVTKKWQGGVVIGENALHDSTEELHPCHRVLVVLASLISLTDDCMHGTASS